MPGFHVFVSASEVEAPEINSCRSRPDDEPNDRTGHMPCDGCEYGDRWFASRTDAEEYADRMVPS